jgi:hypothetical protein
VKRTISFHSSNCETKYTTNGDSPPGNATTRGV